MGFVLKRKTTTIVFEEGELSGLEVVCDASVSVETMLSFQRLANGATADLTESVLRRFGSDVLREWNLEAEGGGPIPADEDGFLSLPLATCLEIVNHWAEAIAGVAAPLGAPSSNGARSPARSGKTAA